MITVNLYYKGANGSARAFVKEMEATGIAAAIRLEAGNLRYQYFQLLDKEVKKMMNLQELLEYFSTSDTIGENKEAVDMMRFYSREAQKITMKIQMKN